MIRLLKNLLHLTDKPPLKKEDYLRVYFAHQPDNFQRYEVYVGGKKTGHLVSITEIKAMLDTEQYRRFDSGETIFFVTREKIFQKAPLQGKKRRLEDFDKPNKYYK